MPRFSSPLLLAGAFFLALLVLGSAGCSSTRPRPALNLELPEQFPNHTVEQIERQLLLSAEDLYAYKARASLAITSPEQSGRFSARLEQRRDDSLYITLSPGLGIEAARALVTPDSFFLYDRIQRRLFYGSIDHAGTLLPAPLRAGDLFSSMLGLITPPQRVAWSLRADSARYVLQDPAGRYTYVVDPTVWRVVRYEEHDASGALVEERVFEQFDRFDGYYLPRRLTFRRPLEHASASLYYKELTINPASLSLALHVGDAVRRVPVD